MDRKLNTTLLGCAQNTVCSELKELSHVAI